jgi:hypothetical protein
MLSKIDQESLSTYENQERFLAYKLLTTSPNIKEIYFTKPNSRTPYDGIYIKYDGTRILFEIKVRSFELDTYPDYILERGKLQNLIKQIERGYNVAYINIFPTSNRDVYSAILFDLNARYARWKKYGISYVQRWMNTATFKSTSKKSSKEVVMLKYEDVWDHKVSSFNTKEPKPKLAKAKELF